MEATVCGPQRPSRRRKDKGDPAAPRLSPCPEIQRSADGAEAQSDLMQKLRLWFSSRCLIFYILLLLKTVLWLILTWTLSHLHLGLPCFVLVLCYWLYKEPLQEALNWAKRRL